MSIVSYTFLKFSVNIFFIFLLVLLISSYIHTMRILYRQHVMMDTKQFPSTLAYVMEQITIKALYKKNVWICQID